MDNCQYGELVKAVFRGSESEVSAALERGEAIDGRDSDGRTARMHAAIDKKITIVQLLVERGADINARDNQGWTALHFATQEYDIEVCRYLVDKGANPNAQDGHGNTPLARAEFTGGAERTELQAYLIENGADEDLKNYHGVSTRDMRSYR